MFIALTIFVGCDNPTERKVFEYQPIVFDGTDFIVLGELKTKDHYDKIELILKHYEITYVRLTPIEIRLPEGVLAEKVQHFGSKAEDSEWLDKNRIMRIYEP